MQSQCLRCGDLARRHVIRAEGADGVTTNNQAGRRVKPDEGRSYDKRMPRESLILGRVLHDDQVFEAVKEYFAKGSCRWRLGCWQPDTRFKPVALVVQQVDERDRYAERLGKQSRDVIEDTLGRSIEDGELLQLREAGGIVTHC